MAVEKSLCECACSGNAENAICTLVCFFSFKALLHCEWAFKKKRLILLSSKDAIKMIKEMTVKICKIVKKKNTTLCTIQVSTEVLKD